VQWNEEVKSRLRFRYCPGVDLGLRQTRLGFGLRLTSVLERWITVLKSVKCRVHFLENFEEREGVRRISSMVARENVFGAREWFVEAWFDKPLLYEANRPWVMNVKVALIQVNKNFGDGLIIKLH
jgi:hypothetical protein